MDAFGFTRGTVRKFGIGMQTRAGGIAPGAMARLPGRNQPMLAVVGLAGDVRRSENLIVVCLLAEAFHSLEHDAHLHAQVRELFLRTILDPHFHFRGILRGNHPGAEGKAVGKFSLDVEAAVAVPVPFELWQINVLFRPNRGHMRVRR